MPKSLSEKDLMIAHEKNNAQFSRRKFLGYAGAATGLMAVLSSCSKEQIQSTSSAGTVTADGVDLGTGDIGILNYAYALEQLEAAFYTMVVMNPYANIPSNELAALTDIRDHEIAHREYFKNVLTSLNAAIPQLEFNFSSITFSSRMSVLGTAEAFEDLGVSAYNGAGRLITGAAYLVQAGKIVSVEARHAAFIRDLNGKNRFADKSIIDANGLDLTRKPSEVLPLAAKYITTPIDASHLPTY